MSVGETIAILGLVATWLAIGLKLAHDRRNNKSNPDSSLEARFVRFRQELLEEVRELHRRVDDLSTKMAILWDRRDRTHDPA